MIYLAYKTGSYTEVAPTRTGVAGDWDELALSDTYSKKIWKFTITRTVGDNHVHIPEIELWESNAPQISGIKGFYTSASIEWNKLPDSS
jgi:hypothetical protein